MKINIFFLFLLRATGQSDCKSGWWWSCIQMCMWQPMRKTLPLDPTWMDRSRRLPSSLLPSSLAYWFSLFFFVFSFFLWHSKKKKKITSVRFEEEKKKKLRGVVERCQKRVCWMGRGQFPPILPYLYTGGGGQSLSHFLPSWNIFDRKQIFLFYFFKSLQETILVCLFSLDS